eukprot:3970898-Amphidinium_carterae.1
MHHLLRRPVLVCTHSTGRCAACQQQATIPIPKSQANDAQRQVRYLAEGTRKHSIHTCDVPSKRCKKEQNMSLHRTCLLHTTDQPGMERLRCLTEAHEQYHPTETLNQN